MRDTLLLNILCCVPLRRYFEGQVTRGTSSGTGCAHRPSANPAPALLTAAESRFALQNRMKKGRQEI